jgi:hypothetical protein
MMNLALPMPLLNFLLSRALRIAPPDPKSDAFSNFATLADR